MNGTTRQYIKLWVDGSDNWIMCENREQIDEAMLQAWGSGEVGGKTVRSEEVEMTEEEYRNIPATNRPWWK